jgi:chorismate dehydratase
MSSTPPETQAGSAPQPERLSDPESANRIYQVGAVSFLNAKPLVYGLDRHPRVRLWLAVPAALGKALDAGRLDVAMVPAIDYQRAGGQWVIVPDGCIASDDETLTVRIFSRVPIERIARLAVDADSHTSVILARLVLKNRYGLAPRFEPTSMADLFTQPADYQPESVLLIGDKVVRARPNDPASPWPHQLDLGLAWREWTGLPFVFAVWAARAGQDLGDLPHLLDEAKRAGLAHREEIARTDGAALGWPTDLALDYMTHHLHYTLTPSRLAGLERFYAEAAAAGLIGPAIPVELHQMDGIGNRESGNR